MKRLINILSVMLLLWPVMVNSAELTPRRAAKPVVSVLGDSYSTFNGLMPLGHAVWYTPDRVKSKKTDVTDVRQTWWWQTIERGGFVLGVNDSYSGATISYLGYNGEDYSDRSFITRLPGLGSPDILLICGATNDSWAGVTVGEYKWDNVTGTDLYTFRPAMARLLWEARSRYPGTEIYFIINSELRDDIVESIHTVCEHYGVEWIQLHDIAKTSGHPSVEGMKAMADQVLEVIAQ